MKRHPVVPIEKSCMENFKQKNSISVDFYRILIKLVFFINKNLMSFAKNCIYLIQRITDVTDGVDKQCKNALKGTRKFLKMNEIESK